MNKNVAVLGYNSPLFMGFREALEESACYELIRCNNLNDLEQGFEKKASEVLIYIFDRNDESQNLCLEFIANNPTVPVVMVLPHDQDMEEKISVGAFLRIVRPLSGKSAFKKCLDEALEISKALQVASESHTLGGQLFDSIDLNAVLDKVFRHFESEVPCQNIHWVMREEFNRIASFLKSDEEIEKSQSLYRSIHLQSLVSVEEDKVVKCIESFYVPQDYFGKPLTLHSNEIAGFESILVPLYDNKKNGVLGYFIFEGVKCEVVSKYLQKIHKDIQHIAKHLGFSIDYWSAQNLSFIDDLTGLYNQKYLELVVSNEIGRSQRMRRKFSVLFIDVDHFKVVNDTKGHWVGSKTLIELGHVVAKIIRSSDYAFRYGGDEFVIVLPETDVDGANIVGERLRKIVEETTFKIDELELNITISIGVATYPDHASTHKEIIKMADEAMYCGKRKSRNIVYIAS